MKTLKDYTALDAAIIERVRETQRSPVNHQPTLNLAATLALGSEWRLIDRRLQELRKRGMLRYDKNKRTWNITILTARPNVTL